MQLYHFMYKHLAGTISHKHIYIYVWKLMMFLVSDNRKYFNSSEELESDMANHLHKHFVQKNHFILTVCYIAYLL